MSDIIKIGTQDATFKVGSSAVTAIFLGSTQVYPEEQPVTDFKYKLTLSNGDVVSAACDGTSAITQSEISAYTASTVAVEIGNCVTEIGDRAFQNFSSLTGVTIPSSVASINYRAFYNCSRLNSLVIPSSVISIGQNAFNNTPWWSSYSADTSHQYSDIIYINDVAYKAVNTSITSVTFKDGTKGIGGGALYNCTSLTSIDIPSGVISIDGSAFSRCTNLTGITIPTGVTSIEGDVFGYCTSLTSLDIPDNITSIGLNSFQYCSGLTSVTIGNGITSIGQWAFQNCSSLTGLTINTQIPPTLGLWPFNNTNNCSIFVDCSVVEDYKTAWSEYASRITCIPTHDYSQDYLTFVPRDTFQDYTE